MGGIFGFLPNPGAPNLIAFDHQLANFLGDNTSGTGYSCSLNPPPRDAGPLGVIFRRLAVAFYISDNHHLAILLPTS
jgi:hypothetical protein